MAKEEKNKYQSNECFVIMPIADSDGYDKGHFTSVYDDIIKVACKTAGFTPVRADEVKQTNLIHLDILKKLVDSPMAICDLSSRNPNVLFELGLRQAFDKPTVLIQEIGTPKIFDISPLRYTEYRKNLNYREVLEDQDAISKALTATKEATDNGEGVNSIISLLSLSNPASLREVKDTDAAKMLQVVMSEMNQLRSEFRNSISKTDITGNTGQFTVHHDSERLYNRVRLRYDALRSLIDENAPLEKIKEVYDAIQENISRIDISQLPSNRIENINNMSIKSNILLSEYAVKNKQ